EYLFKKVEKSYDYIEGRERFLKLIFCQGQEFDFCLINSSISYGRELVLDYLLKYLKKEVQVANGLSAPEGEIPVVATDSDTGSLGEQVQEKSYPFDKYFVVTWLQDPERNHLACLVSKNKKYVKCLQ